VARKGRTARVVILVLSGLVATLPAGAADKKLEFTAGAVVGLVVHETGHLAAGATLDAHPGFKQVEFAGIPFFAITHDYGLPDREEWIVSSAGLQVDHAVSEWILTRHPRLRQESAPAAKGVLAFEILTSVMYSGAAFAGAGPPERDTRAMAISLGVDEAWVGAMVLVPAALDGYRYYRPQARWARWASRAAKVAFLLLVLK
jgi:hypothetical protein